MTKPELRIFVAVMACSLAACGGSDPVAPGEDAGISHDAATGADVSSGEDAGPDGDASTGADAGDAGADGGFNVADVTGLVLWLDAAKGITKDGSGKVSKWADQSGHGNDAVQAVATVQPGAGTTINGLPTVLFTTNPTSSPFPRLAIPDSTSLRFGSGDFYVTTVVRAASTGTSLGMILSKQATGSPFAGYALYVNHPAVGRLGGQLDATTNVGSTLGALNDGVARQYGLARRAGSVSVSVNQLPDGMVAGTSVSADATGVALSIGGLESANGLHPFVGEIAEIIVVKGAISAADRAAIEGYLKTKYALPDDSASYWEDVPTSHPLFAEIQWAGKRDILAGCQTSPPRFCPNDSATRAHISHGLAHMKYGPSFAYNSTPIFTDVPADHFAFAEIQRIVEDGVTGGCGSGVFCPDLVVTRGQWAVYLTLTRFGSTFTWPPTPFFSDVPSSHAFFRWIQKLREHFVISDCATVGAYCPDTSLLRQDLAGTLYRAQAL